MNRIIRIKTLVRVLMRDFWDNIKFTNIHSVGVPEGEERNDLRKYLKN